MVLNSNNLTNNVKLDIAREITNMSEDIEITFKIPNSEGKKEAFT